MASAEETFATLLKNAGFSLTRARQHVFKAMLGNEPLSMHQLVASVPEVDRASIYRAIGLFEQLGIVQRIHTGWKYKVELSDIFSAHHHHATCTHCGRSITINEEELEQFINTLAARHNFTVSAHQIEIQGVCQNCRKAQA